MKEPQTLQNENFLSLIAKNFVKDVDSLKDKVFINIPDYLLAFTADLIGKAVDSKVTLYVFKDIAHIGDFFDASKTLRKSHLKKGWTFDIDGVAALGFERVDRVWNPGEFSLFGDVAIFWEVGSDNPIRVSLFDKIIEEIAVVDAVTRKSLKVLEEYELTEVGNLSFEYKEFVGNQLSDITFEKPFFAAAGKNKFSSVDGVDLYDLGIRSIAGLDVSGNNTIATNKVINNYRLQGYKIWVLTANREALPGDIEFDKIVEDFTESYKYLRRGFVINPTKVVVLTDFEIHGIINLYDESRRDAIARSTEIFKKIAPGDYVVHEDHGIGLYDGIVNRGDTEYVIIRYAGKDRLYVPIDHANKITKFVGDNHKPILTKLNNGSWTRVKNRAKDDTEKIAKELLRLYAMRSITPGMKILSNDVERSQLEDFIDSFKHSDTDDQRLITNEIVEDLSSGKPMDRLLVGDVGFGKTEMAARATFMVANAGFQVVILAPTTILVEQHHAVFTERFKQYPFVIEKISRFVKDSDKKKLLAKIKGGAVDIIIGTHALLSKEVEFQSLGLIVIDEEQRFGVKQKEKLKEKRLETNVLSMSATPIPRTLNMSLTGLRDISVLATPPLGRRPVINKFSKFDWDIVLDAVKQELDRGGQVYFLHNRVSDINDIAGKFRESFPGRVIESAHGQMSVEILSHVMGRLASGEIDILVCTTIIENGIDLANVNTLIVDNAERFGLAQLYQIRGRVGRSDRQGFAHFLYHNLAGEASARLDALEEAGDLGAGFLLSNRDLEIRGAGSLLGKDQSGVIGAIGYGMFINMLSEAVEKLKKTNSI